MAKKQLPDVLMLMKPVDGGRAVIGMVECPYCGADHFTTHIRCGDLEVFCGSRHEGPNTTPPQNVAMHVNVTQIL